MKVINTGAKYIIYNNHVKTYDQLPARAYVVRFSNMSGFFLEEYADIEIKEKIYGVHQEKVDKVLHAFNSLNRNLGVILSGNKGIGKSLFAKMLAAKATANNIPVVIVDSYIPGIATFLESINQEIMVMFDEFDKTFASHSDSDDPQAEMLTLFDGFSQGKKLFVITCNELRRLNDYLVNRPGRFHYHFRFDYPSAEEVRAYLMDKLDAKYYSEIDSVIAFSRKIDLNFDCLRAIAFELNTGEPFKSAIKDLNIINTESMKYNVTLYYENGDVLVSNKVYLDMFGNDDTQSVYMNTNDGDEICYLKINPKDCFYDYTKDGNIIPKENLHISYMSSYDDDDKELINKYKNQKPAYALISRVGSKELHYAV